MAQILVSFQVCISLNSATSHVHISGLFFFLFMQNSVVFYTIDIFDAA